LIEEYTTNNGILPKSLINEMTCTFRICEEFFDLEKLRPERLISWENPSAL